MFGLFPDSFKPAEVELRFEYSDMCPRGRSLRVTRKSPMLDQAHVALLLELAEWKSLFPAYRPESGRTLNGILQPDSGWKIAGVKMKGGAGLTFANGDWRLRPPQFATSYDFQTEFHFGLDRELRFETKAGAPKAVNCLSAAAADREFDCQTRLAEFGLGHPGLLAGAFVRADGSAVRDCHDQPTGVSFSGYDPRFEILGYHLYFELFGHGDQTEVRHPERGAVRKSTGAHPLQIFEYYLQMLYRIGRAKSRCAFEAGVARHACHQGNLLFDPVRDELLVSDTDSCVLLESLEPALRGPQILRDLVSDLFRTIKEFSFSAHSQFGLYAMHGVGALPIHQHLRGYFEGALDPFVVETVSDRLHEQLLGLLADFDEELSTAKAIYRSSFGSSGERMAERIAKSCWHLVLLSFLVYAVPICYHLLKQSDHVARGLCLPEIDLCELHARTRLGLLEHVRLLGNESDRTLAQAGVDITRGRGLNAKLEQWISRSAFDC